VTKGARSASVRMSARRRLTSSMSPLILSDPVLDVLRREIRRLSPDVRVETEDVRAVLGAEVLKREVLGGERAEAARKQVARAAGRTLRSTKADTAEKAQAAQAPQQPRAQEEQAE
jgi:hypothetical protein